MILARSYSYLEQQVVLGGFAQRMVEKQKLHAALLQLVDQQHLISVAARQAVGAEHVQAVDGSSGGLVAQTLQGRANQRRPAVAVVDKTQLRLDRNGFLGGAGQDRGDLRIDGAGLRLLLGGDAGVKRRAEGMVLFDGIALD
jgi:hypothetical protein